MANATPVQNRASPRCGVNRCPYCARNHASSNRPSGLTFNWQVTYSPAPTRPPFLAVRFFFGLFLGFRGCCLPYSFQFREVGYLYHSVLINITNAPLPPPRLPPCLAPPAPPPAQMRRESLYPFPLLVYFHQYEFFCCSNKDKHKQTQSNHRIRSLVAVLLINQDSHHEVALASWGTHPEPALRVQDARFGHVSLTATRNWHVLIMWR